MAKKKSGTNPKQQLKKIDKDILALINRRTTVWKKLQSESANANNESSLTVDQQLISDIVEKNKGPLGDTATTAIFRQIHSACRAMVRKTRVAFLGPEQSYSYLASLQQFGDSVDLIPVATIQAVFEEVQRKQADYGVVPLENSTDGRIADTLTMFVKMPLKICGEVRFEVHHCLLASGKRSEIQKICSKPQALSQCRDWTAKHFPSAQTVSMASTAAAAKLAAKDKSVAAVASEQAAESYQLKVISRNIEDNPNNVTRFAVISHDSAPRTGSDKTAIMFEILHQPGALADTMNVFKRSKLNMTWIESFPMPSLPNEYLFFVEIDGHQTDARVKKAITSLETKTARLTILGSYPAG